MTFVEVEPRIRIYAQDLGEGPPVVLLAGFGMSHPVWDGQVRELLEAGHRVVCIDLRGTGRSDKPAAGYGVARLAADVERVCAALGITAATFVGWSFGGQVSFHLAAHHPELVARLALLCSNGVRASRSEAFPFGAPPDGLLHALQTGERLNRLEARRKTIASGFATQPPDPDALRFLLDVQLQMPSWAAIACYESYLLTDLTDAIDRIRIPVLQILGEEDPVTRPEGARWLADRLPDARIHGLADCGHYPMFEAGEALSLVLREFAAAPA
jgi:pimeloyl-ACP methyl ester carboxylesterase